ncbi:thioredoxin domain-containing protein [Rufibacter tibetensis]|uniref:Uncharacterized protein n=1 Tax=Rufibacter tibetensis TaxID=512763 RepID=A0A0P0BZZ5_9BACT|nr:hypothetical protein [Rufibacter tibetensis]ALI97724.1 hypothetical protein DC20_00355 [Rufibacter tibetensis]
MPVFKDLASAIKSYNSETPEEEFAAFVDRILLVPEKRDLLVRLLPEQHPLYKNRGTNQVIRMRGYILAAFEQVGLPKDALVYVLQELESSRKAYSVAAAAKALRGMENPSIQVVPFLLKAIRNIWGMDDGISFASYKPKGALKDYTTALNEIFTTFQWLGAYAKVAIAQLEQLRDGKLNHINSDIKLQLEKAIYCIKEDNRNVMDSCCDYSFLSNSTNCLNTHTSEIDVSELTLEDQNGQKLAFNKFFHRAPTIVAFFYTRCDNPNKCSLTITRLVQLQEALA